MCLVYSNGVQGERRACEVSSRYQIGSPHVRLGRDPSKALAWKEGSEGNQDGGPAPKSKFRGSGTPSLVPPELSPPRGRASRSPSPSCIFPLRMVSELGGIWWGRGAMVSPHSNTHSAARISGSVNMFGRCGDQRPARLSEFRGLVGIVLDPVARSFASL